MSSTKKPEQPVKSTDPDRLLSSALGEAQIVVRSYDTKSQIVSVGYLFALGVIGRFDVGLQSQSETNSITVLAFWFIVVLPIVIFGYVMHPTRGSAPDLEQGYDERPRRILFVEPGTFKSVSDLKATALHADLTEELCYELLKISRLGELKRKRFIFGLIATAFSFLVIFADQLLSFQ